MGKDSSGTKVEEVNPPYPPGQVAKTIPPGAILVDPGTGAEYLEYVRCLDSYLQGVSDAIRTAKILRQNQLRKGGVNAQAQKAGTNG